MPRWFAMMVDGPNIASGAPKSHSQRLLRGLAASAVAISSGKEAHRRAPATEFAKPTSVGMIADMPDFSASQNTGGRVRFKTWGIGERFRMALSECFGGYVTVMISIVWRSLRIEAATKPGSGSKDDFLSGTVSFWSLTVASEKPIARKRLQKDTKQRGACMHHSDGLRSEDS